MADVLPGLIADARDFGGYMILRAMTEGGTVRETVQILTALVVGVLIVMLSLLLVVHRWATYDDDSTGAGEGGNVFEAVGQHEEEPRSGPEDEPDDDDFYASVPGLIHYVPPVDPPDMTEFEQQFRSPVFRTHPKPWGAKRQETRGQGGAA